MSNRDYDFQDASHALKNLSAVLMGADEVGSRNGRTLEFTHVGVTLHNPLHRELLLPGRKASLAAQIAETMWILAGRNDVEWLSHYLPRAKDFSDDGEVWRGGYGPRIRSWNDHHNRNTEDDPVDQLAHVVELLKADPLSRRAVIGIYDPATDWRAGKDIPCNDFIQFTSRHGQLDMHVYVRSNDLVWGWSGINQFEWSVMQEIVAHLLGTQVGGLHFSIGSLHIYEHHWKKAAEMAAAEVVPAAVTSPQFDTAFASRPRTIEGLDILIENWFAVEEVIRTGSEDGLKSVIDNFPEPMMRSWLRVIAWHWTGDEAWLRPLAGTRLWHAAHMSPKRVLTPAPVPESASSFVKYVDELHREKHKAYGDSWKRRGEMLGIMANIARKIDRLGTDGAGDTATDTAIDLLVYLILYRWWLYENANAPMPSGGEHGRWNDGDEDEQVLASLKSLDETGVFPADIRVFEDSLRRGFDRLEGLVEEKRADRWEQVNHMMEIAFCLASKLHWKDGNATRPFTGYPE